jgi:alkylhydroperoxidase family enzyme
MARINIPEGEGPEVNRLWQIEPDLGGPSMDLREAVYGKNHLPIRVHEAVRYLIANVNQCPICLAARSGEGTRQGLTEAFYEAVVDYKTSDVFDQRERLALEYADRFCNDHLSITDELFEQLRAHFTDEELLDLCVTVSRHLGYGRMTQVLKLDVACVLEAAAQAANH